MIYLYVNVFFYHRHYEHRPPLLYDMSEGMFRSFVARYISLLSKNVMALTGGIHALHCTMPELTDNLSDTTPETEKWILGIADTWKAYHVRSGRWLEYNFIHPGYLALAMVVDEENEIVKQEGGQ
jgi:hypothetical protein